jgi:hypothetical protein
VKKQNAKSKELSSKGKTHSKSTIFFLDSFGYFSSIFSEMSQAVISLCGIEFKAENILPSQAHKSIILKVFHLGKKRRNSM